MPDHQPKNWNNFVLGLLVMIVPLLGLPSGLKTWLLVALGLFIAVFSLVAPRLSQHHESPPPPNQV